MSHKRIYRVRLVHEGKIIEIYARSVGSAGMLGFVEIGELVFGEPSRLVVSPEEEALAREFEGVKRFFVPMHAIVRIDEVEREGAARIVSTQVKGTGATIPFPTPVSDK